MIHLGPYCPDEGVFCTLLSPTPPQKKKCSPPEKNMHHLQGETPKPTAFVLANTTSQFTRELRDLQSLASLARLSLGNLVSLVRCRLEGKLQKKSPQFFFQKKTYFFRICFCLFGKSFCQGDIYLFESTSCS